MSTPNYRRHRERSWELSSEHKELKRERRQKGTAATRLDRDARGARIEPEGSLPKVFRLLIAEQEPRHPTAALPIHIPRRSIGASQSYSTSKWRMQKCKKAIPKVVLRAHSHTPKHLIGHVIAAPELVHKALPFCVQEDAAGATELLWGKKLQRL